METVKVEIEVDRLTPAAVRLLKDAGNIQIDRFGVMTIEPQPGPVVNINGVKANGRVFVGGVQIVDAEQVYVSNKWKCVAIDCDTYEGDPVYRGLYFNGEPLPDEDAQRIYGSPGP